MVYDSSAAYHKISLSHAPPKDSVLGKRPHEGSPVSDKKRLNTSDHPPPSSSSSGFVKDFSSSPSSASIKEKVSHTPPSRSNFASPTASANSSSFPFSPSTSVPEQKLSHVKINQSFVDTPSQTASSRDTENDTFNSRASDSRPKADAQFTPFSPPNSISPASDHSLNPAYYAPYRQPGGPLWVEGLEFLPSLDIQLRLADVFFIYAHGQPYVLFHRDSFFASLRAQRLPPILVLSMCAVAVRFWQTDKYDRNSLFQQCFSKASSIAMSNFDRLDLVYVACFIMLSYISVADDKYWMYAGMAIRMSVALHPSKSFDLPYYDLPDSPMPSEIRGQLVRRLFWDCFMLDRLNSLYCNTQFLNLEDIHVPLPMRESLFMYNTRAVTETIYGRPGTPDFANPPTLANSQSSLTSNQHAQNNMGVLAYMIRMVSIWGRVVRCLKAYGSNKQTSPRPFWHTSGSFQPLDQELYEWEKSLPQRLRYTRQSLLSYHMMGQGGPFACMHLIYLQVHLYIHRYAASVSPLFHRRVPSPPQSFEKQSVLLATFCANAIARILQDCVELSISLAAPFTAYSAYMAGTVMLFHVSNPDNSSQATTATSNLPKVKRHLHIIKHYWPTIAKYANALESLSKLVCRSSVTSTANTPGWYVAPRQGPALGALSSNVPVKPVPLPANIPYNGASGSAKSSTLTDLAYDTKISRPLPVSGVAASGTQSGLTFENRVPLVSNRGGLVAPPVSPFPTSNATALMIREYARKADIDPDLVRVVSLCDWFKNPVDELALNKPLQLDSSDEQEKNAIDISRHNGVLNLWNYGM
ncbi:transcription factor [Schizosaccharomyces cryophilus OY26]|uniref:Transcription factor n=1 Tax=Schizosaccharomyces cryophilus (strain OY26 / ATCC MYA-4695 / CBS 11777 / NBRC 106824 / NRRL Y48691) TaxID=653667 RepID=S9VTU6_SCHCR|nr:transcription factor [Schizosaccharomyces cryophilus OY26]EPY49495.1 transcription factor [Schizosaccharomyces cryophilus OY26]